MTSWAVSWEWDGVAPYAINILQSIDEHNVLVIIINAWQSYDWNIQLRFVIGAEGPPAELKHEQKWNRNEESNNIL